ncbi:hypothetical protein [Mesorhizobium sp. NZP2077]|uniref:hypothetical protein n=1 Tax=Mesorhizobium sp. NZP2077 TaxID=2483404 RepID=UPI0032B25DCC
MPSELWQVIFSVIGAITIGFMAYLRVAGMAGADNLVGGWFEHKTRASEADGSDRQWPGLLIVNGWSERAECQ